MKRQYKNDFIAPGLAWLTVFIPALSYFLATRFSSVTSELGTPSTTSVGSYKLKHVFYLKDSTQLQYPLMLLDDSFEGVVASTWKHDSELGRGFLLVSQAFGNGRIWRWERGGGPIPIGKTLAMDPSGCRSKTECNDSTPKLYGSGGLTVDFHKAEEFREGSLVVSEWGEGRIVRVEEETGARTPLVMLVPEACKHASARPRRVEKVRNLLLSPFGDLIFLETSSTGCSAIMRLKEAIHVPPLESAMTSRLAHKWNVTHHSHPIDMLYKGAEIGSMSMDEKGEGLYVTVKRYDGSVLLEHLSLVEDEDELTDTTSGLLQSTARVEFNFTSETNDVAEPPQAMAVDEKGNVFVAVPNGILVLKEGKHILGTLASPTPITSLTLGEDKYLYVTTSTQLLRVLVRHGPPKYPTNLAPKKSSIKI